MTPQDAIPILKRLQEPEPWEPQITFDAFDALELAIEALEKQIPKPVRITTSTKRCGRCKRQLSGIGNIHPTRNYCVRCGQRIDFGGV